MKRVKPLIDFAIRVLLNLRQSHPEASGAESLPSTVQDMKL
jgi:hypothetical protein